VNEWLKSAGITEVEDDGEWIGFIATVEQAEELLDTEFKVYRSERFNMGMDGGFCRPSSPLTSSRQDPRASLLRPRAAARLYRHDSANHQVWRVRTTALSGPRRHPSRTRSQQSQPERHSMQRDNHPGVPEATLQHPARRHRRQGRRRHRLRGLHELPRAISTLQRPRGVRSRVRPLCRWRELQHHQRERRTLRSELQRQQCRSEPGRAVFTLYWISGADCCLLDARPRTAGAGS
ncbi:MAG: hypothetical protein INR62_13720, partial [Rhodospirillales bacterium]|nr:hypothetical protein [Acetobacter sp.]